MKRLSEHALIEQQLSSEKSIIDSLNYTYRPIRHEAIPIAHKDTFSWAFSSTHSNLRDWIETGDGIFWVSGKAGSGKSTLMKFITGHSRTIESLNEWANPRNVTVAAHYFWGSGTMMQKSQQGLLQSLLHDIFRQAPSVIPRLVPHRWECAQKGSSLSSGPLMEAWTLAELSGVLRSISTATDLSMKICFFIDGLDEFEGDPLELCEILLEISKSVHIKLCVSSRPWNVFADAFGPNPLKKLLVHELTRADIEKFVTDQLQVHPRWTTNSIDMSLLERKKLVKEVANRAEGVFLWAFLVTRSLREGLSNDDTQSDMWRKLIRLPRDLEQLFRHMLETIDPVYHLKMSGMLQMTLHASNPLSVDLYWHLEKQLEDSNHAFRCPVQLQSPSQLTRQREQTSRRLNARTKGLLEVRNGRVEFLHRTVQDFLLAQNMSQYLESKLCVNIFYYISESYLASLKSFSSDNPIIPGIIRQGLGENGGIFIPHLHEALFSVAEAARTDDTPLNRTKICLLLDEYERATVMLLQSSQVTVRGIDDLKDKRLLFREEVLKHELSFYIEKKIQEDPAYFSPFSDSPLFAALAPIRNASSPFHPLPCLRTIDILLEHGEDPNSESQRQSDGHSCTAWSQFASRLLPASRDGRDRFCAVTESGLFSVLLSHGANPNEGGIFNWCGFLGGGPPALKWEKSWMIANKLYSPPTSYRHSYENQHSLAALRNTEAFFKATPKR
ncbi:hypothetical protein B0T10DRAFT_135167 [Thelonectria olida]|uniref:NACHT domain-containing protein n=1 Tax=Thelonectria olida TaxID=1576542 RepID=A0A9P8W017_9HYPO|nr:hypothetical protein B0T10DRAFT_135167 [Thelonectria olida]